MDDNSRINKENHKVVVQGLFRMLAGTQAIYLKTKNYHWHAIGAIFQTYHMMFEKQYADLVAAFDVIAERIQHLGYPAPDS